MKGLYLLTRNCTSRAAALGLLLLVLMLAVPTFDAGHTVLAKGPGPATADSTKALVGQGPRPAIHPLVGQGLSQSLDLLSQQQSSNWSGYVVSSAAGSVTDVNGSWIVPSASCALHDSYSATWVGIDGWLDSTVEQIGTDSDCQGGTPVYYAWYEFYPSPYVPLDTVAVSAGDVISAEVSCRTGGLQCKVSITDANSGQSFSYSQAFEPGSQPQMSSADWIAEAVSSLSGQVLPLPTLGQVYSGQDWTGVSPSDSATVNGTSGSIGSYGAAVVEIIMFAPDRSTLAQPSGLSLDGTSFSVAWSASGSLVASCSPTSVVVGSAATCRATVGGFPLPTGVVTWSSNRAGKFSTPVCKLSGGACSVKYTPTTAGSVILTASYGGDFEDSPSAATYGLAVAMKATSTTVSCTPKSAVAGSSATIACKAKVTGYSPTGAVNWSQSGTGSVSFASTACTLSLGACSVTLTGSTGGQVTISATYMGDSSNQVSSQAAALTVKRASTALAASCVQSSIGVGANVTCTATVSGGFQSHNGTITWSKASGKGSVTFSSATCALSSGSCSVTVTATAVGSVKIKAVYGGDADNQVSSRAAGLTITKAPTILTLSCTESSFSKGVPVTCTAAVSGGYTPITGTVTWSKLSGTRGATFSSTTCTLSSGSCQVTITSTAAGSFEIKAAYGGDSNNLKSSGTLVLTVS